MLFNAAHQNQTASLSSPPHPYPLLTRPPSFSPIPLRLRTRIICLDNPSPNSHHISTLLIYGPPRRIVLLAESSRPPLPILFPRSGGVRRQTHTGSKGQK